MTLQQALNATGYAVRCNIVVTKRDGYIYALSKFFGIERRSLQSILTKLHDLYRADTFSTGWQPINRDEANKVVSTVK